MHVCIGSVVTYDESKDSIALEVGCDAKLAVDLMEQMRHSNPMTMEKVETPLPPSANEETKGGKRKHEADPNDEKNPNNKKPKAKAAPKDKPKAGTFNGTCRHENC